MATQLRIRAPGGRVRIEFYDDADPVYPGSTDEPCQECRYIDLFESKLDLLTRLFRVVRLRYPNVTRAQIRSRLVAWLDAHPAIRDALIDGEGW
jgi:hypothetical protein